MTRGTTNGNVRGGSAERRRRRAWLVGAYRADRGIYRGLPALGEIECPIGDGVPACRCYRCGTLLTEDTVTIDRIVPGCRGGTYRRNNIRPACGKCNSSEGGRLRRSPGMST